MSTDGKSDGARSLSSASGTVDDVDRRLLAALAADPRASWSELGRRVGLSTPTVSNRIARLQRLGVIRGFRLDVDPAALGLGVMAWVRVRPGPGQLPKVADLARNTPEVSECHRVTGEDCFVVRVYAPDLQVLEQILDRFLLHGQTTSAITVSSPVPLRSLPME